MAKLRVTTNYRITVHDRLQEEWKIKHAFFKQRLMSVHLVIVGKSAAQMIGICRSSVSTYGRHVSVTLFGTVTISNEHLHCMEALACNVIPFQMSRKDFTKVRCLTFDLYRMCCIFYKIHS
ncbi:hypothetical protein [Bacillus wiedmannii]|uniref:hypothetical protein n=1 Tax=Bacillus wiedmannii TaxID=1890302 RepID=UPI000BF21385|nr:hypothetical protein [Bacillus wiedmannii]PEO40903.1 hypothetical protein CN555_02300 [Bacillus wiedmannii]